MKVTPNALENVPKENRKRLIERLDSYLKYFREENLSELYDLTAARKRQGLSKQDFIKSAKISKDEGEYDKFWVENAVQAEEDEYVDEPKPSRGEGNKWFIKGCMKIKLKTGKAKKYQQVFDIWLTDGDWFINRGGFVLGDGGYQDCKSK